MIKGKKLRMICMKRDVMTKSSINISRVQNTLMEENITVKSEYVQASVSSSVSSNMLNS